MASPGPPERYRFGSFELQLGERRLLRDGAGVPLRPRAFDLLAVMVDRAGHLVTKDELLDRAWPGVVVEEAALHVQVSALRKVLGADTIATVSGQGYRFTLPVAIVEAAEATARAAPRHNLPNQITSFIGREQEIAQLTELVTANRLVTLTGSSGAGKTRLALQVAGQLLDAFPDGVWLVELAALSDPRLVPQAVAQALALADQPMRPVIDTLSGYLASKTLLLVLDNIEHLLEGCVQFVDLIVRRSPHVAMLVTSRERLGMAGELTYRVPSLTVPGPGDNFAPDALLAYEGVRLFVERARLLRSDFSITSENTASQASICYRLDGIPLAIELAAPRLRSMSVEELSQRLDQRFALLIGGSSTALPRHRTLRSMIDWSYDLLTDVEQAMLRRVSVFAGGCTLAAAEHVCTGDGVEKSDTIGLLTSLADKNLLTTEEPEGTTRYRMETIRQYALDRLRETCEEAQWRARHLACFLSLAEKLSAEIDGPQQRSWLARVASEHDNLRAALAWPAESSPIEGLRLASALPAFWHVRGHLAEGRQWLARLLDAVPVDAVPRDRARGLHAAALLAIQHSDYAAAKRLLRESLVLCREIDDPNRAARVLGGLTWLSNEQGLYPEAEVLARESVDCARAIGDRKLLFASLGNLAVALHARGQWAEARKFHEQALGAARELGTPWETGCALNTIGREELEEGRRDLAREHLAEAIRLLHGLDNPSGVAESLDGFAAVAAAESPLRAVRLWAAAEALRQEIGNSRSVHESIAYERHMKPVRAMLTSEAFDQAWDEGRAMSLEDAVRYALDEQAGRDT